MNAQYDDAARESFFRWRHLAGALPLTYGAAPAVKAALLTCALLLATGCASSQEVDLDGGDLDAAPKTDAPAKDSSKDGAQSQCVPQCTTDQDCENSCPAVPNGVNCCDTSTGICYAYAGQACPAPVQDAGFD